MVCTEKRKLISTDPLLSHWFKINFFLISKVWRSSRRTSIPWTSSGSFVWLFCCSRRAGKPIKCYLFLYLLQDFFFLGNTFCLWKEECLIFAVRKNWYFKFKKNPDLFYLAYLLYIAVLVCVIAVHIEELYSLNNAVSFCIVCVNTYMQSQIYACMPVFPI